MTEIRCKKCNRLLMEASVVLAKIKCPKCGYVQEFGDADLKKFKDKKIDSITYQFIPKFGSEVDNRFSPAEIKFVSVTISI